ncbi:MAG: fructose-bisphosphatase class II [Anaerolineae bacterium]|nr:fructose-bisphosphatase class II [Anaerolineae bacterium]
MEPNISDYLYHNLGLDLVRATERAALAAGRWMGKGQPEQSDRDATSAMEQALNEININGRIVFSEQDKLRETDRLHPGQAIGTGTGLEMDLVVDDNKVTAYRTKLMVSFKIHQH